MQWVAVRTCVRCPDQIQLYPSLRRKANRVMRDSAGRRHVGESARGDDGSYSNHGIIAEVKKKTRKHRAGPGADEGENNPNENKQADQPPVPSKLRGVHESKEETGQQDTEGNAGANGAGRFHAEKLR